MPIYSICYLLKYYFGVLFANSFIRPPSHVSFKASWTCILHDQMYILLGIYCMVKSYDIWVVHFMKDIDFSL